MTSRLVAMTRTIRPELVVTPDGRICGTLHMPSTTAPAMPILVCIHGSGCTSRYFDLSTNSLVTAATECGFPVLLIDRPGHGASAVCLPGSGIDHGIAAIADLLEVVRVAYPGLADRSLALIGHSFGGAIALAYAAARPTFLAALCVSGIADRPDTRYSELAGMAAKPSPYWLFGPGSSYDWRGVTALRAAASPWRAEEVAEVIHAWPMRWAATAAAITCPVQLRLAEYERIWETGSASIDRIASAFKRAARVDVAIAPDGGHLYEAHLRGPELIDAQLAFIRQAATAVQGRV